VIFGDSVLIKGLSAVSGKPGTVIQRALFGSTQRLGMGNASPAVACSATHVTGTTHHHTGARDEGALCSVPKARAKSK
jgi:hypothetical protein